MRTLDRQAATRLVPFGSLAVAMLLPLPLCFDARLGFVSKQTVFFGM